jgi:hypothetical protein
MSSKAKQLLVKKYLAQKMKAHANDFDYTSNKDNALSKIGV